MRTIKEVIDNDTEESIVADIFFAKEEADIFKQRSALEKAYRQQKKLWVCPYCRQLVKIRGRKDGIQSMHFAHFADRLDCPIKTGRKYTRDEILRMKYNGQKEGLRHNELKNLIAGQISKDKRFEEIKVEQAFAGICKDWRKPDVSAIFNGKRIVFELQLNTTFLSIIIARNLFYQDNQTYILWVFDHKLKKIDDMRFMEKDILYPNHHNAFFIDETAKDGQFGLFCGYQEPTIVEGSIKNVWQLMKVDFADLTFSPDFQVYWFDYEKQKKFLLEKIDRIKFLEFGNEWRSASNDPEGRIHLLDRSSHIIKKQCKDYNPHELRNLLDCLYSLKFQEVIGSKYFRIVQALHQYLDKDSTRDSHFGKLIFKAIRVYALDLIKYEDRTNKFYSKGKNYLKQKFQQSNKYDPFLRQLFPELF